MGATWEGTLGGLDQKPCLTQLLPYLYSHTHPDFKFIPT